jgi:hypothetical protein
MPRCNCTRQKGRCNIGGPFEHVFRDKRGPRVLTENSQFGTETVRKGTPNLRKWFMHVRLNDFVPAGKMCKIVYHDREEESVRMEPDGKFYWSRWITLD